MPDEESRAEAEVGRLVLQDLGEDDLADRFWENFINNLEESE